MLTTKNYSRIDNAKNADIRLILYVSIKLNVIPSKD